MQREIFRILWGLIVVDARTVLSNIFIILSV